MKLDDFELELAARHGLSDDEIKTAEIILSGKAAFPLRNYPRKVVSFVADLRERQQRNAKRFSTEIST